MINNGIKTLHSKLPQPSQSVLSPNHLNRSSSLTYRSMLRYEMVAQGSTNIEPIFATCHLDCVSNVTVFKWYIWPCIWHDNTTIISSFMNFYWNFIKRNCLPFRAIWVRPRSSGVRVVHFVNLYILVFAGEGCSVFWFPLCFPLLF